MEELNDFKYFKENQLANINFETGQIDVWAVNGSGRAKYVRKDVGSINQDGYSRMWCHNRLRMKHRLIYWLYYSKMPNEIDHIDGNRNNNSIHNLRSVNRTEQLQNIKNPSNKYSKFNFKKSHFIRILRLSLTGKNTTQIAKDIGCSRTAIKDMLNGRRKKYNSFINSYYKEREFND